MKPKVAILLATHNRAHFLGETLDSVLEQTYRSWECIIVDDRSEDHTEELVSFYLERDRRFSYFKKKDNYKPGLSGTRNCGLDLAQKKDVEFIQFFDDDDIMHPRMLELKVNPFLRDPSLDLSICCYRKFHSRGAIEFGLGKANDLSCNIRTKNLLRDFFLNKINLNSPGPLWSVKIIQKYRFREDLLYGEERDLYLRIFLKEDLKFKPVEQILFWYRKHSDAITKDFFEDKNVKHLSLNKSENSFLMEILEQKEIPGFILKVLLNRAVKEDNKKFLNDLWEHYRSKNVVIKRLRFLILLFLYKIKWQKFSIFPL